MNKVYRTLLLLAFLLGSNVYPLSFASASDSYPNQPIYNNETEIRSDIGVSSTNVQVGQYGYKVFTPGALAEVQVSANSIFGIQATITRHGATDVWLEPVFDPTFKFVIVGWNHLGSHESNSSIAESTIEAHGHLKVTSEQGWHDTCDKVRSAAKRAVCTTDFYYSLPRTIRGESDHFFSTPGYPDSSFETSDQA